MGLGLTQSIIRPNKAQSNLFARDFMKKLKSLGRNVALHYPATDNTPRHSDCYVSTSDSMYTRHSSSACHTEKHSRSQITVTDDHRERNPRFINSQSKSLIPKSREGSLTVASSGSPSLTRRKHANSSTPSSSAGPGRVVGRFTIPRRASEPEFPFWQQNWFIGLLFVMAIGFFCLAVFLIYSLDLDTIYAATAPTSEGVEITYGTVLKLMHEKTKFRLHSHDVPYGSGSGQQSVTSFPNVDDANSYWIVKPELETAAKQGVSIPSGTIIRLQHMRTRKWLHSHLHASPITGNQEVSCFGGENDSDTGDHWRLTIEGSGKTWKQDQRVRLQHVDTGVYLHSHDKKYTRIAGGQQEVCGVRDKRADNVWLAAEGVYLPVTETK